MLSVPTTCPYCACGCGFFLQARDGDLVGVAPGESHPVAGGRLCARGWNAHEAPVWGKRVQQPMVRRDGELREESWERALQYVASRLKGLIQAGKLVGVLGSARATNEENYLAGRLARAGLQTNNIDFSHHAACRPLLAGVEDVTGEPFRAARLADIETSDVIVLVEGDLAKTHPRAAASVLTALGKGARLIVVGCVPTQMARLAARFVQTLPGGEGNAINGLLAAVLRGGAEEGRPQAISSQEHDALRRELADVEVTEETQGAAGWIAAAKQAVFLMGPTAGRAEQLRGAAAAFAMLAAIGGAPRRQGSGLLLLLGRSNVRGAGEMGVAPDRLPGYARIDDAAGRERLQRVWGKAIPHEPGLDAAGMLESASGLIVLADDPAAVLPQGRRARAAMERLEFLVVLDAFFTPAVKAAHAVLPVASLAETEGTLTNMEGRVQRVRPASAPPGQAMEGWKALARLCARFDAGREWSSAADVLNEIAEAAPRYSSVVRQAPADGWGSTLLEWPELASVAWRPNRGGVLTSPERPYVLAWDGVSDWGSDPLVAHSPTLSRDTQSERKLFPSGLVEMNSQDADALGVRAGWRVRLSSAHGEAVTPIRLRKELPRGVVLAPYGFRDWLADVLGEDGATAVKVERV